MGYMTQGHKHFSKSRTQHGWDILINQIKFYIFFAKFFFKFFFFAKFKFYISNGVIKYQNYISNS